VARDDGILSGIPADGSANPAISCGACSGISPEISIAEDANHAPSRHHRISSEIPTADELLIGDEWLTFAYGGHAFALDLTEERTLRAYEMGLRGLKDGDVDTAGAYCARMRWFLDELLGEGAGDKLLGAGDSLIRAHNCVVRLLLFVREQLEAVAARQRAVLRAFSPERAERTAGCAEHSD